MHLITAMYASKGHSAEYVRNFCLRLKSDYAISLYIASHIKLETPEGIKVVYVNSNYTKTEANNFIKYGKLAPYVRAIHKQFFSYKYYNRIIKNKTISKADLVFIMDYDVIPLLFLINRLKGAYIFLWLHNAKFKSKDVFYKIYKGIFKTIFNKFINKKLSSIVVNGEYIKNEATENLKIANDKILVIQYPSEIKYKKIEKLTARKKLGLSVNANIVLFFGMLRKDKNIEKLIESVAKSKTNTKLIIAGSEASVKRTDINTWIEKHQLEDYMLDIDYISEEKMALYYSCSDLLLLTYNLESGSQSGPLSLAREFELPAIVPDIGEIGAYVSSNKVGFVINPLLESGYTDAIDCFFNNRESKEVELKKHIKKAKENYSWNSAKNKYKSLFSKF